MRRIQIIHLREERTGCKSQRSECLGWLYIHAHGWQSCPDEQEEQASWQAAVCAGAIFFRPILSSRFVRNSVILVTLHFSHCSSPCNY